MALFTERVVPILEELERGVATPISEGLSPRDKARAGSDRLKARDAAASLRTALFPDD